MARGGLGRDFYSILDDNMIEDKKDSVSKIKVNDIEPRRDQPRKNFDEESIQLLADSISIHGVLQPIIVRENSDFPNTYEIIAGERRWRAAKMAGLSEIPAITVDGDDLKVAQIALVENVQRENLNPVEEAFAYQALVDRFGLTQEQLSKEVGKSRSAIANMLRLIDLPDEVLSLLKEGKITNGHARAILGLDDEDQMIALAQKVYERDLSVREVEKTVRRLLAEQDVEALKVTHDESVQKRVYMRDLERRVMDKLGRKVKINQTTKKKTVELTFDNDADLEELLTLICGKGLFNS
ncbi:MAG: ParB/RepB/Spo0J family partition protein [Clostridia bacterium]|nr:ParB/RepB/Spo0J family partition protein [Clostridia bacterium]MBR4032728.1 ParB/RepB/Spo0J family partition protein [Clostridia bacterium]